jgi:heme-degrading monooxygenase HmoA
MATPYTLGVWQVKPGNAEEFIAAWVELAEWTKENVDGARWAKLVRDTDDEDRFVSFGPWENFEAIEAWRELDGFQERVGRIRQLLESFEPFTLESAADIG